MRIHRFLEKKERAELKNNTGKKGQRAPITSQSIRQARHGLFNKHLELIIIFDLDGFHHHCLD